MELLIFLTNAKSKGMFPEGKNYYDIFVRTFSLQYYKERQAWKTE